jgi:hypothetical protein
MKVIGTLFALFVTAQAFTSKPFAVTKVHAPTCLSAATSEGATEINRSSLRTAIAGLTAENFSSTLAQIEPFLLNDAGVTCLTKSVRKIGRHAKVLGVEMPANFAKEAKATSKRREKQDAFVKVKIEEAADAAEAKVAEEAAAAEAKAAEEAAPEAVAEEAAPEVVAE